MENTKKSVKQQKNGEAKMQQQIAMDFSEANFLRDDGMNMALLNAESKNPGWQLDAMFYLLRFLDSINKDFQVEEVRSFAHQQGLAIPPTFRAWGGIVKKAVKEGLIKKVGIAPTSNAKAHRANAAVWRKTSV